MSLQWLHKGFQLQTNWHQFCWKEKNLTTQWFAKHATLKSCETRIRLGSPNLKGKWDSTKNLSQEDNFGKILAKTTLWWSSMRFLNCEVHSTSRETAMSKTFVKFNHKLCLETDGWPRISTLFIPGGFHFPSIQKLRFVTCSISTFAFSKRNQQIIGGTYWQILIHTLPGYTPGISHDLTA